jgi:hypothetical protein
VAVKDLPGDATAADIATIDVWPSRDLQGDRPAARFAPCAGPATGVPARQPRRSIVYATIRQYSQAPGLVNGIVAGADSYRALLQDIGGFRAYYLLRTREIGAISISIFDDRDGTESSTAAARAWMVANAPAAAAFPPVVSKGEVVVHF